MILRTGTNGLPLDIIFDISVARAGREAPESWGEISNKPQKVAKLVERLGGEFGGEILLFAYEAGPCGYGLYRQLVILGQDCQVVAPLKIPQQPGTGSRPTTAMPPSWPERYVAAI